MTDKTLTLGEQERLVREKIDIYKEEMKKKYIMEAPLLPRLTSPCSRP